MRAVMLVVLGSLAAGCDDVLFGIEKGDGEPEGPSAEGFAGVEETVGENCLGCHGAAAASAAGFNLDLETDLHGALVGVTGGYGVPLVTPNQPDQSLFLLKLQGENPANTGGLMPPGGLLPAGYLDVVEAWILDGAPAQ